MDDHTARLLGGRYRLLRPAGRGGMSEVHVARDEVLGRDVAVKLVRADQVDDAGGIERLEREARSMASLSHANVVTIHDVLRDGDDAAIVMELLLGGTLADRLRGSGPLDWREAITVASAVARGLAAAHDRGLVHRDVKPSNVLLGEDGQAKVADFGIAGTASGSTRTATIRGSIPYLAPEQARGEVTDARTDVYALGCVLFEMLTGRPPFADDTGAAIIGQHLHRAPPPPRDVVPELPPALDAVVLRMLRKEPSDRHPDMAAVLADLEAVGRGDPATAATAVLPRPAPVTSEATRTEPVATRASRTPVLLGIGGVLAVVALLVMGWRMLDGSPTQPAADVPASVTASPSPTDTATPSASTSSTPTPSPTPPPDTAPARPETVDQVAAAFRRELVAGRGDGQASAKAVEELDKLVTEIVQEDREGKPKDVREKARKLDEKIDEMVEKGEITSSSLADTLQEVAQEFLRVA